MGRRFGLLTSEGALASEVKMVCVAYCLAVVYVLFAVFLVFEEWYPHHCQAYKTEYCGVRILLWVSFLAIVIWSAYTNLGQG